MIRFLTREEYERTKPLAAACFGDDEELERYYRQDVGENRVAVMEKDGRIVSMVQLRRFSAEYGDESVPVWYMLYVCTAPDCRGRGYMDAVMGFVLDTLRDEGEPFCFLVPVDEKIYAHLGFVYSWRFREEERSMLYAEGYESCYACLLGWERFSPPERLRRG